MIEAERLSYIRKQQKKLRTADYTSIKEAVDNGIYDASTIDNVGSKRLKHSSFPITSDIKQNEEEDVISKLPDEILTHILSLLSDADAYRTRILSNRWNHLCFFLPSLCFKMPNSRKKSVEVINKFYDFVDKTFSLHNRDMPVIKRFFLSCSKQHYDHNRVLGWLRIVLHSKHLYTLELGFLSHRHRFSLSLDLLNTCNNTLVDLTLKNVDIVGLDETRLLFPCLKTVNLESIEYSGDESPQNLISACHVLHELCLNGQELHSQLHTFKISSPSLKRLRIHSCVFGERCEVVIDAPKLEYFYVREYSSSTYSLTNSSSLVEAHTDIYSYPNIQLLTNISSARILTQGSGSLMGLSRNPGLNLPVFPNLIKLIVHFMEIPAWDILFILLNNMPSLEHITIDFGWHRSPFKRRWNPPTEAPACLRFTVKEVVIRNENAVQMKDHVTLIKYLLNHSSVLEKLELNSYDIDRERREKLMKILPLSKSCRIEFS